MRFLFVLFSLVMMWPVIGVAKDTNMIVGSARVIDGDTIDVAGVRIRLFGIDTVEKSQTCKAVDGREWKCGLWVTHVLEERLHGATLQCEQRDIDKYGRVVARCFVEGADIAQEMVQRGQGFAYRKYSRAYVADEAIAVSENLGLWQGEVQRPDAYRAARVQPAVSPNPSCDIKGNISRNGRIYHVEGQRFYDRTGINLARGERWFCTEAEAIAAGWRPANI